MSESESSNCANSACTLRPGVRTSELEAVCETCEEVGVLGLDMMTVTSTIFS